MPARVEQFPLRQNTSVGVLKPLLGCAALVAVVALIRRYTREPSLPRMSEQWLVGHQSVFNRDQSGI
jgi:hypothetical protein